MTLQAAMFFASLGLTEEEINYDNNEIHFEYKGLRVKVSKIAATDYDKAREVRTFMVGLSNSDQKTVGVCLMWATKEDFMDVVYEKIQHLIGPNSKGGAGEYVNSYPAD